MNETTPQVDIFSTFYNFLNSATAFGNSIKEHEQKYKDKQPEFILLDVIKHYHRNNNTLAQQQGTIVDYLIDTIVPEQYRSIVKGMKKLPVPQIMDMLSPIVKKYGEDGKGGYKTAEEFLDDIIKHQAKRIFFQR